MTWIKAASLAELRQRPVVFKHSPKQIAVFSVNDSVYAVDNRCPHEGYPLAAGQISQDCILTCTWHNWKFRLDTGECLIGGDHVRNYPVKVEDGQVWIDIADPPKDEMRIRILGGLKSAFEDRDYGRICREIARLHYYDVNPADAVAESLHWAHDRLEFGTTHAIAGAADWLRLARSYSDDFEKQLVCLSQAVDHLAFDSLRQPEFPYQNPGSEPFNIAAFLNAIEGEDVQRVEAMVSRGLSDRLHWSDMEPAFVAAAFAHYNDFGHSVIYVHKTAELAELMDASGRSIDHDVISPLARHLCYTTREDLLPEFKDYAPALESIRQLNPARSKPGLTLPFPADLRDIFEWVKTALQGQPIGEIYDRLLEALALSVLCYDTKFEKAYEGPVSQNIGWLDFTHGITMANAARHLCSRYPQFWVPALCQLACFVGRNHRFIDAAIDRQRWFVEDEHEFFQEAHQQLFDHGYSEPIYSVHLLKTAMAVADELPAASESCRHALLAALNRFLHSPMKTRHVRRLARQAIGLVSRDFEGISLG